MPQFRAFLVVAALLLGVGGCASYDPPIQGDHTTPAYQTDLDSCRATSSETVRRQNAATPWTWIKSPFTGPPRVRAAIRSCMAGKGYVVASPGS
jgi:hypothetical protein